MSVSLRSGIQATPQDENAMTTMRPGKTGGLTARGGIGGGTVNKPPSATPAPAALGQKSLGMQQPSRRALGDITNAGGGSSGSGLGGVMKKSQPSLVASLKPLSGGAPSKPPSQKQPQKLSAPIQLISSTSTASSIPSASSLAAEDDEDMSWIHVDQAKGDGMGHLRALDHQEELAVEASAAIVAHLGDGKMFRPSSPIPWERSEEEANYNALLTAQLPSASDLSAGLAAVEDFDLQF